MARALPPLSWFRSFESAARNLSFTGAARELGLTQSAISQQVQALETRLGCLLFDRKNRGLVLTDEGRRLMPTVADALGTLRRATESFDAGSDGEILTVATSVSVAQWYIVPRIAEFTASHPGVTLRLMTKLWPDEFTRLSVDVEIRFDSLASKRPRSVLLGGNRLGLVAAPELVGDTTERRLSTEEVLRHPLIQVVGTADTWQDWARRKGLGTTVRPSFFVDSYGLAIDMARSGSGIALASMTIAAPSLRDGTLVQVEPELSPANDGYHLSVDPGAGSSLPGDFSRWLLDVVETSERAGTLSTRD